MPLGRPPRPGGPLLYPVGFGLAGMRRRSLNEEHIAIGLYNGKCCSPPMASDLKRSILLNLKILGDNNSKKKSLVRVQGAKGNKERYTLFSGKPAKENLPVTILGMEAPNNICSNGARQTSIPAESVLQ